MEKPKTYCSFANSLDADNLHKIYHDTAYGFPIEDDDELFERLILEINQAGLSWTTILNKQQSFKKAYHNFNIKKVAAYKEKDIERLLNDAGIIRNRLKINAAIHNAQIILQLQKTSGSFKLWIDMHHPLGKEEWVNLFKQTFKFTGGEIVNEFLMSTGYLPHAHETSCPVYKKTLSKKPAWYAKK
jgi:DNA-3-methyladenine glycosylase I